jgi:replicative DNA helicase
MLENITREELILRRIFDDSVIQNKVLSSLNPELFDDIANQSITKAILIAYKKFGKFPQARDLNVILPDNSLEKNRLLKIINYDVDAIDKEVAVDVVETFFKEKKTEKILIDAAEAINQRNFKNISAMISELEKAVTFSLHLNTGLDLVKDTKEALRRLNETHKPIPSAISDIRAWTSGDSTTGGWYRAALSVFQGMPNVGKTILLCNEAAYAYQCGYNVLYVSLEMAEELIWERLAVNVTDIPIYSIRKESNGDIEKLLKQNKEKHARKCGNIKVRQLPSTTTPLEVENVMNEVKISEGYNIDILFVDYLGEMKPAKRSSTIQASSLYSQGKEVAEQLRDLAVKYEMPVVTASQVNREGYNNILMNMKNTAESAGVNNTADLMITITQDPYLEKYGLFLHTIIKNRFGPKMQAFVSQCDYQHMRVRSATGEQVAQYKESMLNQDVNVTSFTTLKTNSETALEMERIEKEKHDLKEKSRIQGVRDKIGTKESSQETSTDNQQEKIVEETPKNKDILDSKVDEEWEKAVKEAEASENNS